MLPFSLNLKGRPVFFDEPLVMGIINLTPDSFFFDSRKAGEEVLHTAERMLSEGAAILDMGGCSTRPGSLPPGEEEELRRLIPAVEAVHHRFPDALISADTFRTRVASEAIAAGACMINDVSGMADSALPALAASFSVPYILMHTRGTPDNMQQKATYHDVVQEVGLFFAEKISLLLELGVHDIILDPGIGFGKLPEHNRALLQAGDVFSRLGFPLMVGVSRKSAVTRVLQVPASDALNGTTVLHTLALQRGYGILRAHDVKEAVEAIRLTRFYL